MQFKSSTTRSEAAMSYEDIIVERVEGWIEITINRPEKLNSLRERTAE
jgi:1,4-dihydroxy-2-naphthoyl-CoA synthase